MLAKSLLFSLITFGIAIVVGFLVAVIVKIIAVVVQREKKGVAESNPK